jgi:hypothetical protein
VLLDLFRGLFSLPSVPSSRKFKTRQAKAHPTGTYNLVHEKAHAREIPYSMLVLSMVKFCIMSTARKITVEVPPELLKKAQHASGAGVTQTVRAGLEIIAASQAYARLRQMKGKVRFSRTAAELKADR